MQLTGIDEAVGRCCLPPRHAHGDMSSLAPHERLPEVLVVPRDRMMTPKPGRVTVSRFEPGPPGTVVSNVPATR